MPEPCGCSSDDEAIDVAIVCEKHAPYPPREVWAAARVLAASDPIEVIPDLDAQEDEVRSHFYLVAQDALIAARDVRDAGRQKDRPA